MKLDMAFQVIDYMSGCLRNFAARITAVNFLAAALIYFFFKEGYKRNVKSLLHSTS